jgi:putative SOS response-associated peptidase YedK
MAPPCPADEITCWPVSPRVGSVKNNDPSLIELIDAAKQALV